MSLTVQHSLPSGAAFKAVERWQDFVRSSPVAAVLVVHVPDLRSEDISDQLRKISTRCPCASLVALVPRVPEMILKLLNVGVTETVWTDAGQEEMRIALDRARSRGLTDRIAHLIEASGIAPAALREGLAAAVRNPKPPRRVDELASLFCCDRSTLWKHCRSAFPGATLQPGHFVDWVLLIHGVASKRPGRKWCAVADSLGIHEHTLRRLAKRHTGLRLADLEEDGQQILIDQFQEHVLQPLGLETNCSKTATECCGEGSQ